MHFGLVWFVCFWWFCPVGNGLNKYFYPNVWLPEPSGPGVDFIVEDRPRTWRVTIINANSQAFFLKSLFYWVYIVAGVVALQHSTGHLCCPPQVFSSTCAQNMQRITSTKAYVKSTKQCLHGCDGLCNLCIFLYWWMLAGLGMRSSACCMAFLSAASSLRRQL